jgi:hypothetical protein
LFFVFKKKQKAWTIHVHGYGLRFFLLGLLGSCEAETVFSLMSPPKTSTFNLFPIATVFASQPSVFKGIQKK